jgi:hypothetical protein
MEWKGVTQNESHKVFYWGETLEFFVDPKEITLYLETTTTFHLSAMQMIDILIDL